MVATVDKTEGFRRLVIPKINHDAALPGHLGELRAYSEVSALVLRTWVSGGHQQQGLAFCCSLSAVHGGLNIGLSKDRGCYNAICLVPVRPTGFKTADGCRPAGIVLWQIYRPGGCSKDLRGLLISACLSPRGNGKPVLESCTCLIFSGAFLLLGLSETQKPGCLLSKDTTSWLLAWG